MKKYIAIFLSFILVLICIFSSNFSYADEVNEDTAKAEVLEIISSDEDGGILGAGQQLVKVKILSGKYKGEEVLIQNELSGNPAFEVKVDKGDKVIIFIDEEAEDSPVFYISNFVRDRYVLITVLIFAVLLLIIGKKSGLKSLITLSLTALIVIKFMLPMILKGHNPIVISVLSAIIITIITFLIVSGFNSKSISAIIGTLIGVLFAGFLAYYIGSLTKLTGLSSEEANMLMYIPQNINFDFKGLLFAGIIVGTLGAVMDVAMSISSAMYEMKSIHPEIDKKDLMKSGLNIGRDIMGTMTNTLILAYTGSSISLLLLFMAYEASLINIVNMDLIATEIIRAMTGSIGLIIAIPATVLVNGLLLKTEDIKNSSE